MRKSSDSSPVTGSPVAVSTVKYTATLLGLWKAESMIFRRSPPQPSAPTQAKIAIV